MKSGCRSCALAAESSSALALNRRKITHTYTSIWATPMRLSAPTALRYSVSIRTWAHTKLIRQIVLTVTWTELKRSNAASLVKLPAANHRQTPLFRSVGDISGQPVIRVFPVHSSGATGERELSGAWQLVETAYRRTNGPGVRVCEASRLPTESDHGDIKSYRTGRRDGGGVRLE